MIYDISIEGISLVSNYRAQFNRIIQTAGTTAASKRLEAFQSRNG